uniref:Mitochondrial import inner membrane translocase subunit Tim21 n=1 Tax=Timema tahoe TaxID=61484 RepID=A0A7R9NXX7_9NEOP|nr:unnamed protein product [Timema tahoe]
MILGLKMRWENQSRGSEKKHDEEGEDMSVHPTKIRTSISPSSVVWLNAAGAFEPTTPPSHLNYERDGKKYLRMKFYIQGIRQKATVHLEMMENDRGKFEYRYLFAQLDDYPRNAIILEDNRYNEPSSVDIDKAFETL